jgi:hypothetical protein
MLLAPRIILRIFGTLRLAVFLLATASILPLFARTYYVAKIDTLNPDGTLAHPYPHIQQAANLMTAGDTCVVRAGTYRETVRPTNSGSSGRPLLFMAYANEKVVVHGGDPLTSWTVYNAAAGIYKTTTTAVRDLFVNGQMMLQARHPNMPYDSARGGFVMLMPQDNTVNPPAGVDWSNAILIRDYGTTWVNEILQLNAYQSEANGILIAPVGLIDAEGEWAYKTNTLYLKAPRNRNPSTLLVESKTRDYGFNLQQRNYITVRGITFFGTSLQLDQATYCIVDSCKVFYPCPLFISPGWNGGFNRQNGATANVNGKGVVVGGSNNVIRNCEIAHSWGDGVTMYGTANTIEYCHIYDCDWSGTDCATINTGGSGHTIRWNTLNDAGRSVLVHRKTGNTRIENNDMFGAGWLKSDLGITYTFESDGQNSSIAYNLVHACYAFGGGAGIYLDNRTSNYIAHHNAIFSIGPGWKFYGFGCNPSQTNNRWYNNTLDNVLSQFTVGDSAWANCNLSNNIMQRTIVNLSPSQVTVQNNYEDSLVSPQFVDPDVGDLTLKSTSPCIDKGRVIAPYTDNFAGSAPDQGAYESGRTAWAAGCPWANLIWKPLHVNGEISRRAWRVFAGANSQWTQLAVDGRMDTRWESYTPFPPATPMFYMINLGAVHTFNKMVLYSTARPDQMIQNYEISVSADGSIYGAPIASGAGSGGVLTITFPKQTSQYVKITRPGPGGAPTWAIDEIYVVYDTTTSAAMQSPRWTIVPERAEARLYAADGSFVAHYKAGMSAAPAVSAGVYAARISDGRTTLMRTIVVRGKADAARVVEDLIRRQ